MPDNSNYEVRDPEIEERLKRLGALLGAACPDGWGFSLFLFKFGENGSMFYMSSAERESVISAIIEWLYKEGYGLNKI